MKKTYIKLSGYYFKSAFLVFILIGLSNELEITTIKPSKTNAISSRILSNNCGYAPNFVPPKYFNSKTFCNVTFNWPDNICRKQFEKLKARMSEGIRGADGQFPQFAGIEFNDIYDNRIRCSGVLISQTHVLTAGHCAALELLKKDSHIRVGLTPDPMALWKFMEKRVKVAARWCRHPRFNPNEESPMRYDLSVIKLTSPVELERHVQPACLPSRRVKADDFCYSLGIGYLSNKSPLPADYMRILPVKYHKDIYESMEDKSRIGFRASLPENNGTTCKGDSGGPVLCIIDGKFEVHGLLSGGSSECKVFDSEMLTSVYFDTHSRLEDIIELVLSCQ